MHSKDSIKLRALNDISLQAIDKKDYKLCIVASDHILKINPVHSQALTLKYIGLYKLGYYTSSLCNFKHIINSFTQEEITASKKTMKQHNTPHDTIYIQLMDELVKKSKRVEFIKKLTKWCISIGIIATLIFGMDIYFYK